VTRVGFILKWSGSEFYFSHMLRDELTMSLEMSHAWFTEEESVAKGMAAQLKQATRSDFEVVPYVHEVQ